jgi:hypothetical protein
MKTSKQGRKAKYATRHRRSMAELLLQVAANLAWNAY